jgi:hypothetical protein
MNTWILAIFIWYIEIDGTTAVAARKYDGFNSMKECKAKLESIDIGKLTKLESNTQDIQVICLREG